MNAVAPPGLKADQRRSAEEEGVRLTIDFDDVDDLGEPLPHSATNDAEGPSAGDPVAKPGSVKGAKAGRPGPAQTDPANAAHGDPVRPSPARKADTGLPNVPPQLASIEVTLSVEVGNRLIPLRDLLAVEPGQLFALDRMTHEPVTILVNGKPFAHGEVVAIGERFGVRLLDILPGGGG